MNTTTHNNPDGASNMKTKTGNVWTETDSEGNVIKVYGTGLGDTSTHTIEIREIVSVDEDTLVDPFEFVLNNY
jgi:hypothetical protein